MNKHLCLSMLLCGAFHIVFGQNTIRGKVYDAATSQPIPNVSITTIPNKLNSISDKDGNFTFPTFADSVFINSIGYRALTIAVTHDEMRIALTPSFGDLNEVVVSGSRDVQKRTEVPVAINVISKTLINETKATRLDMLINKVPGVFMTDLGNEQHSMSVRQPIGYNNLFLYLEDGIPIRTVGDFNHNALIEINQASLQRIEVIKGPASSLYGSEAVGGAINFITQSPSPFLSGKIQMETGSRGYNRTDFSLSNTYKKLGVYAGGYYANQNQPTDEHNDFNKGAFTIRADYAFNDKTKLVTVADLIRYKTDQKGGLDSAHFYNRDYKSFYRFTYRKVDAFRLRTTLSKDWNEQNKTSFTLFYRNTSIGQNPFYSIGNVQGMSNKAKGQVNEDAFKSYGAIIQHTKNMAAIKAKWIAGLSVDYSPATYLAQYIAIDKNAAGVFYDYHLKDSSLTDYKVDLLNTAAYTQFEWNALPELKLVAAARYDRLDYKFNNHLPPGAYTGAPDAIDHFDHFTPKLGATYDFGMNKGLYVNYSVGFAPPNINDLYTGVKVPELKPASYNNYEVGGWFSFAGNKGYAELSLYKMNGKNEIISVRLPDGSYINQNAGATQHKGVEVSIKYAPVEPVTLRIGGTYAQHIYIDYSQQGKDFSGNKMAQAPPYIVNGEITYKPAYIKGFRIAVEYQGMGKYFTDPQNTATYKGFNVLNARMGYAIKAFELWVNCINLTNKIYAVTVEKSAYGTSYRPGQLRTLNLGIAYSFAQK